MALFPEHVFDSSLHTCIVLGLLMMWLWTETFGWPFAGFVVTGYLAALAIVHPMSLLATVIEAILTYVPVLVLARSAAKYHTWSPAFGRERFMLFLLVSVVVRILVEGFAAPHLHAMLAPLWTDIRWSGGQFFSIGIILVPLTANAFWKTGLSRGLCAMGLSVAATCVLIAYVVSPLTNFHLGPFEASFDTLALDFLASPKLQIVLLCTLGLAAYNNQRFGWDYNGILVPALLAVTFFEPMKAALTVAEGIVLAVMCRSLLQAPGLRGLNLEGPRRLVLVATLAYFWKLAVAHGLAVLAPEHNQGGFFGFGYLLTSLLAVKCLQLRSVGRVVSPLLVTATQGFLLGSGVVFAYDGIAEVTASATPAGVVTSKELAAPMQRAVLQSYSSIRRAPPAEDARTHGRLSRTLRTISWLSNGDPQPLSSRPELLHRLRNVDLDISQALRHDGTACIGAREPRHHIDEPIGLPIFWACGGDGPALWIPRPFADPDSLWIGSYLAARGDFSLIVINGLDTSPALTWTDLSGSHTHISYHRRIRHALGERPVVILTSTPQGPHHIAPSSIRARAALRPLTQVLGKLSLDFSRENPSLEPLRAFIAEQDAILTVSVAGMEATLAPSYATAGEQSVDAVFDTEAPPERIAVLPAWRQATSSDVYGGRLWVADFLLPRLSSLLSATQAIETPPRMLQFLAHHLQLKLGVDPDARAWTLQGETSLASASLGRWALRKAADSPWIVHVPETSSQRLVDVAKSLFDRLGASVLWRPERAHWAEPHVSLSDSHMLQILAFDGLLSGSGGRGGARRLLSVREQPREYAGMPALIVSLGAERASQGVEKSTEAALASALWDVASMELDAATGATAFTAAANDPLAEFQRATTHLPPTSLWFSPSALHTFSTEEARDGRAAEYALHGVLLLDREAAQRKSTRIRTAGPRAVKSPPVLRWLRYHLQTAAWAPIDALRRAGVRTEVAFSDLGTQIWATGRGWVCRAAGTDDAESPLDGCWSMP